MKEKLILNHGDKLVQIDFDFQGGLSKVNTKIFSIVNEKGIKVGTVIYKDQTSIFGERSQTVDQRDLQGRSVVDVSW